MKPALITMISCFWLMLMFFVLIQTDKAPIIVSAVAISAIGSGSTCIFTSYLLEHIRKRSDNAQR